MYLNVNRLKLIILVSAFCLFLSTNLGIHEVFETKNSKASAFSSPYLVQINELLEKTSVSASKRDLSLLNDLIKKNNLWFEENRNSIKNSGEVITKRKYINITMMYWVFLLLAIGIMFMLVNVRRNSDFFIMTSIPAILVIMGVFDVFQLSIAVISMLGIFLISKWKKQKTKRGDS